MRIEVMGAAVYAAAMGAPLGKARRTVVMLHGAGMAPLVWSGQQSALGDLTTTVLAPTLPGHGAPGSSRASGGAPCATIEGYVDWLLGFLDIVGVERAVLVGHSMGALIALATAAAAPQRVVAVAAIGAAQKMPVHPMLLQEAAAHPQRAAERILGWGIGPRQGGRPPGLAVPQLARRVLNDTAAGVLANDLAACNACTVVAARVDEVRCPVLVLAGARDRMTPAKAGRALAAALPDGELIVLPNVGHMLPVEAPTAVATALRNWLRSLESA